MEASAPQPQFEFATATRIIFGCGTLQQLPELASGLGRRVLLAIGSRANTAAGLQTQLAARGLQVELVQVRGEPTLKTVAEAASQARNAKCDVVIGLGGGSVLDTAKAVAALLTNTGDLLDYVEVAGGGQPLANPAVACIAVPTTAGTGAEVTRNSVMSVPAQKIKVSLRSAFLLPRVALVDPQLTLGLPPAVTASTGMDALTQLIEPYVSPRANPLTDALVRMALPRAVCDRRGTTALIWLRAKTWRWPVCAAAWLWPTRALVQCTGWQRCWAAACQQRTAASVRGCCHL